MCIHNGHVHVCKSSLIYLCYVCMHALTHTSTTASDSEHDVSDVEEHSVTAEASPELVRWLVLTSNTK